jgi:hypothetical protein
MFPGNVKYLRVNLDKEEGAKKNLPKSQSNSKMSFSNNDNTINSRPVSERKVLRVNDRLESDMESETDDRRQIRLPREMKSIKSISNERLSTENN